MSNEQNLSFTREIENLTDRELSFLRVVCNEDFKAGITEMRGDQLKTYFLKQNGSADVILSCLKDTVRQYSVPEKHFEWLQDNLRAQLFTLILMRRITIELIDKQNKEGKIAGYGYLHPPSYKKIKINKNGFIIEEIYELFDNYKIDLFYIDKEKMIEHIEKIQSTWLSIYKKCDYNSWLEVNSKRKIEWTENYLKEKNCYIDNIYGSFLDQQKKFIILASLDLIEFKSGVLKKYDYKQSDGKKKFIDRMEKSWNQKKYRDAGRERKLYRLALTKRTKDRLGKMARANNVKPDEMLERLINYQYENNYFDKNDKEY